MNFLKLIAWENKINIDKIWRDVHFKIYLACDKQIYKGVAFSYN